MWEIKDMRDFLIVGTGSFIGGVSRYYLGSLVMKYATESRFPFHTLFVNFIGCLLIGIIASFAENQLSSQARLFLVTGLLGGFTTFSAFGYETFYLIKSDSLQLAVLNVLLSVVLCLIAVWAGNKLNQALF